ncbi:MAG: ATP-binding protein [Elusimicrobia bacterium]|nr:ATP-binding protein [Elusimicrobiota bacterium]
MSVSLGVGLAVFVCAAAPAALAWSGRPGAALAAAAAAAVAAACAARRWLSRPLEEFGRGLKRWGYGDFDVPVATGRLAAWPRLARDFGQAQAMAVRALDDGRRELERERVKLETVMGSVPEGLVVLNLRGDILYLNQAAVEILDLRAEEVRPAASGIFEVSQPDRHRLRVQQILKNHTMRDTVEFGAGRFYRTAVNMFSLPGQAEFGVLLAMRDITDERQLDALKEEFFQHAAHDLRAPIFAMQGYLRLLEKSFAPNERQQGYFCAVSKSCEKLMLYIGDTLDSARIETGHIRMTVSAWDPAALIGRATELFGPLAREKGVALEFKPAPDAPVKIVADERLMERVLSNLLSNAIKFTPRQGRITVALGRAGADQAEFSVSDTGPGIPPEQKTRIFEKFRQTGEGAARGGFGLGLTICLKIVQLHGGSMWVVSEPGQGSQFVFRMPIGEG